MGLYFVAVGMSINVTFAAEHLGRLLLILLVVEVCKILATLVAAWLFGLGRDTVIKTAFLLAPCGEFGFVLFAAASAGGVITETAFAYSLVLVSLSMAITPFVVATGYEIARRLAPGTPAPSPLKEIGEQLQGHIVIVGYNSAGRLLCMMLERTGNRYIAFDYAYSRVRAGSAEGHAVEYGDVSDPAMQGAAAIAKAKLVAVMLEDPERTYRLAEQLRSFYPSIPIFVAVADLATRDSLRKRGIKNSIAISVEGNLLLASNVLTGSGVPEDIVEQIVDDFRKDDYALLRQPAA
jgi:CPA2 family monovalent cation:H+ antiporter-2